MLQLNGQVYLMITQSVSHIFVLGREALCEHLVVVATNLSAERLTCTGVVIWELVTGQVPERGRLRKPVAPAECPAGIADLIEACLTHDPSARPSARQVYDSLMARWVLPSLLASLPGAGCIHGASSAQCVKQKNDLTEAVGFTFSSVCCATPYTAMCTCAV